jgi:hypothetical protein
MQSLSILSANHKSGTRQDACALICMSSNEYGQFSKGSNRYVYKSTLGIISTFKQTKKGKTIQVLNKI